MKLRPSNAIRWVNCSGSFALESLYPADDDTPEAREGTAAHWYATEALQGRSQAVGAVAPNGHPVDAEMVENAQPFLDDVAEALARATHGPASSLRVEAPVTMHLTVHEDCEGQPDAFLIDMAQRKVIVWDYKYGHRHVEPFNNVQLWLYVLGVFEAYELSAADVADVAVSARIVQPRNYMAEPVRTWETTGATIFAGVGRLRNAALSAKAPDAPTRTGSHCRDCTARHACPALQAVGAYIMDLAGTSVPNPVTPNALGLTITHLYKAQERLEALIDAMEADAAARIRAGAAVPGWTMGYTTAREKWTDPDTVMTMGDLMGLAVRKPQEPVTPAQARKLGLDAAIVAACSTRPTGAAKLIPVSADEAAKVFSRGT